MLYSLFYIWTAHTTRNTIDRNNRNCCWGYVINVHNNGLLNKHRFLLRLAHNDMAKQEQCPHHYRLTKTWFQCERPRWRRSSLYAMGPASSVGHISSRGVNWLTDCDWTASINLRVYLNLMPCHEIERAMGHQSRAEPSDLDHPLRKWNPPTWETIKLETLRIIFRIWPGNNLRNYDINWLERHSTRQEAQERIVKCRSATSSWSGKPIKNKTHRLR